MIDLRLPPQPQAVPKARRALSELTGLMSEASLEDARLLVSELVTNSVRHGDLAKDQNIILRVEIRGSVLRVEVRDEGAGFELAPRTAEAADDAGWGLYLVALLAEHWGISNDGATTVWFELPLRRELPGKIG